MIMSESHWRREGTRVIIALVILVVLASIVGTAYILFTPSVEPMIATIDIDYYIESAGARDYVMNMVEYAMKNDSVKAVVLRLDCPGGWADAVEEVYFGILRLRDTKPVVASVVGYALSGGYYIAVSANYVYAVPTSFVGNVGVIAFVPSKPLPSEQVIETGPNKIRGFSEEGFMHMLQMALSNFIGAVTTQRGNKLLLNSTELSTGSIFLGSQAAQNGMVDALGSSEQAIEKAAALAGTTQYKVISLNQLVKAPAGLLTMSKNDSNTSEFSMSKLRQLRLAPTFYYVYLPPQFGNLSDLEMLRTWESRPETSFVPFASAAGKKVVLVDLSHANAFLRDELVMLVSEIVSKEAVVRYVGTSMDFKMGLSEAAALVVISPMREFSNDELTAVKDFVKGGGRLLIITEPTRTYAAYTNSLSGDFGIVFGNDYLYSLKEYDGFYRNIYVTEFEPSDITAGLRNVAFYTASTVYSKNGKVAFTNNNTYSSEAERATRYPVIVFRKDEGILAIGDMTFLTEPYCYVEDNYQLLTNIAAFLTGQSKPPS